MPEVAYMAGYRIVRDGSRGYTIVAAEGFHVEDKETWASILLEGEYFRLQLSNPHTDPAYVALPASAGEKAAINLAVAFVRAWLPK
jgi:hypothetical protein